MRITTEPIVGYISCPNIECPGTLRQEEVPAIRETTELTFGDKHYGPREQPYGPSQEVPFAMLVENSYTRILIPEGEEIAPCPHCGQDREGMLSDQVRPVYRSMNQFGQSAWELVKIRREQTLAEREFMQEIAEEPEPKPKPTVKDAA